MWKKVVNFFLKIYQGICEFGQKFLNHVLNFGRVLVDGVRDFWQGFLEELDKELDREAYKFLKRHRKVRYPLSEEDKKSRGLPIRFLKQERLTQESIMQMDKETYDILMQTVEDQCSVSIVAWICYNLLKFKNKALGLHPLVGHKLHNGSYYYQFKRYVVMIPSFLLIFGAFMALSYIAPELAERIAGMMLALEDIWWYDDFILEGQIPKTVADIFIGAVWFLIIGMDWFYEWGWVFFLPFRFLRFKGFKYFKSTKIPNFVFLVLKIVILFFLVTSIIIWLSFKFF